MGSNCLASELHVSPATTADTVSPTVLKVVVGRGTRFRLPGFFLTIEKLDKERPSTIYSLQIMEVAGLVLGVYPVVILVFEQFKTGSEYFSNWRQFRRQYEGFIRDIEAQQLFFEGTLQDLLCGGMDPYLSGSNSKDTFRRMVSEKSQTGWNDPKLIENLKARLDKRYDWYMYTIQRIHDIFEEFTEVLDIQAVGKAIDGDKSY